MSQHAAVPDPPDPPRTPAAPDDGPEAAGLQRYRTRRDRGLARLLGVFGDRPGTDEEPSGEAPT